MPIVQVQVWQGFGEDRARRLIEGITASFEGVGVPPGAVQVIIQEIPRTHWGVGGQVSSERPSQGDDTDGRLSRPGGYRPQRSDRGERPVRQERPGGYRPSRDQRGDRPAEGERSERPAGYRPRSQERTDQPERRQRPSRDGRDDRSRGPGGPGRTERTERSERRPRSDSRPGSRPRRGSGGGPSSSRP